MGGWGKEGGTATRVGGGGKKLLLSRRGGKEVVQEGGKNKNTGGTFTKGRNRRSLSFFVKKRNLSGGEQNKKGKRYIFISKDQKIQEKQRGP